MGNIINHVLDGTVKDDTWYRTLLRIVFGVRFKVHTVREDEFDVCRHTIIDIARAQTLQPVCTDLGVPNR